MWGFLPPAPHNLDDDDDDDNDNDDNDDDDDYDNEDDDDHYVEYVDVPCWAFYPRLLTNLIIIIMVMIMSTMAISKIVTMRMMTLFTINEHMMCSHLCCIWPEASDAVGYIRINPERSVIVKDYAFCEEKHQHLSISTMKRQLN